MASHVITSDVIDRYVDPATGILHSTRIMTKEGRLPKWSKAMFKIKEAVILETSQLDPVSQTFTIKTRNLSHAKIMLVEETQTITPCINSDLLADRKDISLNEASRTDNIVSIIGSSDMGSSTIGTAIKISARIISNTGFAGIRSKIESFGLSRIKENTLKVDSKIFFVP
ncbi:hypothetical protein HDU82_007941 [Entophlyctis luteolus]|nr:hypothetical protein HDU82_007941 [Entophlyctis luteolus]KAJ3391859.1 hypothetical protein HDU84_005210 [Entophlyctis sp. JEL0112]